MPKRKREEPSASPSIADSSSDRTLKRARKLCAERLSAAQKPLVSALRLAAGFERQKYSRRRKTAQSNHDANAVARLDAEYAVLKQLDIPKIAEQHLRKTIAKVKSLRENEVLPESARNIEKGEKDAALLNVQARLYKVDAVRKVVDEVIEDLKQIVGVDVGTKGKKSEEMPHKKKPGSQKEPAPSDSASDEDEELFAAFDARIAAPSSADEESEDSLPEDQRPPSAEDTASEPEEAEEASEVGAEETDPLPFHKFSTEDEEATSSASASQISEDSSSEPDLEPLRKSERKEQPLERASESKFLPSLSHAAYYSGSESEASDLDTDLAPRKNRRGQKARQKIWEKKFGGQAKHLQKQERNKGWDPKRGAVGDDKGRRGARSGYGRGEQPGRTNSGPTKAPAPKRTKRDDSGPLHPSWAAAKAAKEKKVDMKPQGKKVVFD